MKYKIFLLLSIIIHTNPYICRYFPFVGFTICEPGRFCETKAANLKEKKQKQEEIEFYLHLIKENEPEITFNTAGQSFIIKYLGTIDRPYADEWQIGIDESNLKTVSVNANDIFFVTAVRLFFDRIIKLKMLYNNIVGVKNNIQYKHPKNFFYSEHFEALRGLEGFIKETTTSGKQLKSLIFILNVMINLEEFLRPAGNNCELGIVQFLNNLTAFKDINGNSNLYLVNKILERKWFPEINEFLIECEYNRDCILEQCNAKNINHKTIVLCGMDDKLFSFIKQMKTEKEFNTTATIINENKKILLSNNLLSSPEVKKMRIRLEDAKKVVDSFRKQECWDEKLTNLKIIFEKDILTALKSMDMPAPEKSGYNYLIKFEKQYQELREVFVKPYLEEQKQKKTKKRS
jgi:hypothetical protein